VFCGESMFSAESGASKVALAALCRQLSAWGVDLLDAQVPNPHLQSLGASPMPRCQYLRALARPDAPALAPGHWDQRFAMRPAASAQGDLP
jgi:leucyl/phenylalanyl-tRNA--protein transferase